MPRSSTGRSSSADQIRTVVRDLPRQGLHRDLPGPQGGSQDGRLLQARQPCRGRAPRSSARSSAEARSSPEDHLQDRGVEPAAYPGLPHRPGVPDRRLGRSDLDRDRHQADRVSVVLRMVGSRSLWEQMKGRGVRKIEPNEFWAVTPGAREDGALKDHFVIVDCVGMTDEDRAWAETQAARQEAQRAAQITVARHRPGEHGR